MAKPRPTFPRYSHHKSTGRAYVKVAGRFRYLGRFGSAESHEQYARFIREYQTTGTISATACPPSGGPAVELTVAGVLAAFWTHAKATYDFDPAFAGRRPPGEIGCYWDAMQPVLKLFAATPAVEFGPKALQLVRAEMIAMDWCRNVVNRQVVRVRFMFKWAVSQELIPGEVLYRLASVGGLRKGHKGVRDTDPVEPVPPDVLAATLAVCTPRLRAMIELHALTGMRSGNLCKLRTVDIDTSGGDDGLGSWTYQPAKHKNAHRGHKLTIRIGPKARDVLRPYLKPHRPDAFVFSPADEMEEVRAARTAARATPLSCGNTVGSNVKRSPRKLPGDHYTPGSYAQAVTRACDRADAAARKAKADAGVLVEDGERLVARWHPHQLRHNKGTAVRAKHGTDGVLAALGQKTAAMADRYAEIEAEKAERIAVELG
jgi:integrase